ncbi:hypothetical protein VCRA2123O444_210042 [Vibrio crassostreae]|nr:hypothetical protein VCRA2117O428_180084 [Vibrio crassostreae]CAK1816598.1 hypothetical protein VCRA2113O416_180084 [Vibrio crassostreae]CAK1878045.1 hypothetical protein VCRA2114O422_200083 [Vibrio crassostreae]CAK1881384.1 hypothetical protein VCRA2119O430_200042 [Vibrio crassostreae]CAK1891236.1 hypothetical protein VCRA2118O429_200019 [Vibrio crassostreae]
MKKAEIIGIVLTVVWCILFGILLVTKWDSTLTLNEWGDFLAGSTLH